MVQEIEIYQKTNTQSQSIQQPTGSTIVRNQRGCQFMSKASNLIRKEKSKLQAYAYFLLITVAILHTLAIQLYFSQSKQNVVIKNAFQFKSTQTIIYYILFGFLIFTKIILLLSVGMEIIFKIEVFGLSWITKNIIEYGGIFISFDLALTAFMAIADWTQNAALLFLSVLLSIFQAIYLQNYTFRKDRLYVSSAYDYLIFCSIVLVIYLGNILFFVLKQEIGFYIFYCFIGLLHLSWYLKNGHSLFIYTDTNLMFIILNSAFFTVYAAFMEKVAIGTPVLSLGQISKIILVFSTLIIVLYIRSLGALSQLCSKDSSPKIVDILTRRSLESEGSDIDLSSQLIGTLQMHQLANCLQSSAFKAKQAIYDPYLKVYIKLEDLFVQKQTGLLYLVKEQYQRQLEKEESNKIVEDHIDYCQFLCNEHSDFYIALKLLNQIKYRPLNIIQKIKISALESFIEAQSQRLNQILYDGTLQIEHIIEAEDNIAMIELGIMQYIAHNLIVWKTLGGPQKMRQSEMRKALKWSFATFSNIEAQWKKITRFIETNKVWRSIYTHYQLFIRNERLKQRDFDQMGNGTENDSIISRAVLYFDQNDKEEKLIDPAIMFDRDTGCISTTYQDGQLIINRVNKRFSRITKYSQEEIVGCQVETLMTPDVASIHSEKFKLWLEEGHISNQLSHKIRFTTLLTKDGLQISAVKYYKTYYHPESGLEFVCLLKFNIKPDLNQLSKTLHGSFLHVETKQLVNCQTFTEHYSDVNNEHKHRAEIKQSIFSKEEFLQPRQTFKQVQCFGLMSRIFTVVVFSSIIILSLVIQTDSTSLNGYTSQFMTIMIMYRSPIMLITSYMKSFLGVGSIGSIKVNVNSVTTLLLSTSSSQATKRTLFDGELNPDATYYPYYKYPFLANDSLSSIDLYNTIISSVASLSLNISNSAINRTSLEFQRYNSYLKPAYDNMMNSTKFKLHETFTDILSQSITIQLGFVIGQAALFVIFLVLLFYLIQTFNNKMDNILDIILNFTPNQTKDIRRYWKRVEKNFDKLFRKIPGSKKYSNKLSPIEAQPMELNQSLDQPEFSANKRSTNIADDQRRKSYKVGLQIFTILGLVLVLGMAVLTQALMIEQFHKLQRFQADGFYYLKYFPSGPILAMGCMERYYSRLYPSDMPYNPQRYDDSLFAAANLGYNFNYIANAPDSSSPYYVKQKNYFFGSPCEYAPNVLTKNGMPNGLRCTTTCNGTLKQGLSSFMRYASDFGSQCIKNNINYTATQIDDFAVANVILAYYMFDAMETWTSEFTSKAQQVQSSNLNSCLIVMGVAIIVHLVINENMVFRKLKDQYSFIRRIYMNMIPEDILIKEKVLRQKFVIEGIIKP